VNYQNIIEKVTKAEYQLYEYLIYQTIYELTVPTYFLLTVDMSFGTMVTNTTSCDILFRNNYVVYNESETSN